MGKKDRIDDEFDEVVKMPPKSRRRYLLIPQDKIIQTITAWKFPCRKAYWTEHPYSNEPDYLGSIYRTKKDVRLESKLYKNNCPCGKGCKPQKVRIIVKEVNDV